MWGGRENAAHEACVFLSAEQICKKASGISRMGHNTKTITAASPAASCTVALQNCRVNDTADRVCASVERIKFQEGGDTFSKIKSRTGSSIMMYNALRCRGVESLDRPVSMCWHPVSCLATGPSLDGLQAQTETTESIELMRLENGQVHYYRYRSPGTARALNWS